MSEDQSQGEEQRALTVVKERLIAHSSEPMWDSAAFDHMGRVASVMAESGLASDTLLNDDAGNPANPKTVVARMLLIAHMARETGANPLMFLQGCSRIGKKIHLEGKLVNAIVRARTGVNLRFQFGRWDTDRIELPELHTEGEHKGLPVDADFFKGIGDRLAIRVSDPDDPERHVEGSVGLWKTDRRGSPWTSQGNWRRQLRYRGAPEWARAYEPGAVLGIYSEADQDIEDDREPKTVGLMARLKGTQEGDGFNADEVAAQTEKPKRKTKAEKLVEEALAAAEPAVETEVEDIAQADTPDPVDADVSEISEEVNTSYAAPGEVYLHVEDSVSNAQGRRVTFKDGGRWSAVSKDGEAALKTYAEHSPEIVADDEAIPEHMRDDVAPASVEEAKAEDLSDDMTRAIDPAEIRRVMEEAGRPTSAEGSTVTEIAPPAEPEPDTSEPVTPASDDGPEASDSGPSADPVESLPNELAKYGEAIEGAASWEDATKVMTTFLQSDYFKALPEGTQNKIRGRTWANLKELGKFKMPDVGENVQAFRLFIEQETDAEAISGTFKYLRETGDPSWNSRQAETKNKVHDAVERRLKELS